MMKKKRLSVLVMILCLVLCVGLFPISASAIIGGPSESSRKLGTLQINKTIPQDADADETLIDVDDAFSKMQFTLYATEDIVDPLGGVIITKRGAIVDLYDPISKDFTIPGIITAHTNGIFKQENIPLGKYLLKETKVPDGIVSSTSGTEIVFSTYSDDPAQDATTVTCSLTNDMIRTKFYNTDASGATMLAGSGIAVYKKDGTPFTRKDTSALAWTSSNKAYFIEGLPVGEYFLRQTSAAEGYVLRTSDVPLTVADTKNVQSFTMRNKQVTLEKAAVNGKKITGAAITVTDRATGAVVDTWTDDGTAHVIKNLTEGHTYTVHETTDSTVTFDDMDFTVNDDYTQNQALLWDAFTCTHRGGTATTTKKAICAVCGEAYGELLTETPSTPQPSEPITEPTPSEPATEPTTEPTPSAPADSNIPKTGDDANLFPFLALLLSACAIALLIGKRKRNF